MNSGSWAAGKGAPRMTWSARRLHAFQMRLPRVRIWLRESRLDPDLAVDYLDFVRPVNP